MIIAGLVHDIVENTPFTEAGLTTLFGACITQIVWAAARLEKELPSQKADNARTISGHTVEKQIEKVRLIQKFYIPLAAQLQLVDITHELQLHTEKVLNLAMLKD
ncbi:hypothetical protein [Cardinium endosymbiont of Oedothorax gibbosus]|uniref:hypothetical protein n=1 Tax=Cardinium endosymbiont of Oedothorax gibbosus TaxID=931101 RepID=UPI00202558BC|nr:hypothetical protein [Cardinium endosymbiont of Oedothorax gibbosus]CAH2559712.1 HD-domain/PDEase-like family protein [Cardinium endosymbiont of Oedothorax gibbosus]